MAKESNCGNCWYARPFPESDRIHLAEQLWGGTYVWCQRFPPVAPAEQSNHYPLGSAVLLSVDAWCGEHQPANPETVEEAAALIARQVLLGNLTAAYGLIDKLNETRQEKHDE